MEETTELHIIKKVQTNFLQEGSPVNRRQAFKFFYNCRNYVTACLLELLSSSPPHLKMIDFTSFAFSEQIWAQQWSQS